MSDQSKSKRLRKITVDEEIDMDEDQQNEPEEDEPAPAGKRARHEEEQIEKFDGDDFDMRTLNVTQICTAMSACLSLLSKCPDDCLVWTIDPRGMQLHAKPKFAGSAAAVAFFDRSSFQQFERVNEAKVMCFPSKKCDSFCSKLKKAEYFRFTPCVSAENDSTSVGGIMTSGTKKTNSAETQKFEFPLMEIAYDPSTLKLQQLQWPFTIQVSSDTFKANVEFMSTDIATVQLAINARELSVQAVSEAGDLGECIKQDVKQGEGDYAYVRMFSKQMLKVVTAAVTLNKTLQISFDPSPNVQPILFRYDIDSDSHFCFYLMPSATDA